LRTLCDGQCEIVENSEESNADTEQIIWLKITQ
jgi:hypothetical protein